MLGPAPIRRSLLPDAMSVRVPLGTGRTGPRGS